MGEALKKVFDAYPHLVELATNPVDGTDTASGLRQGSAAIPFDVNDVIAHVHLLRDADVIALDNAVDKELAGRGLPDSDDKD